MLAGDKLIFFFSLPKNYFLIHLPVLTRIFVSRFQPSDLAKSPGTASFSSFLAAFWCGFIICHVRYHVLLSHASFLEELRLRLSK